jgi:molecular chaperone GrpE
MPHSSTIHNAGNHQSQEYLAGWQRARAELDNFRKRIQAGQVEQQEQNLRLLLDPILVLNDNLRAMVEHTPPDLKDHGWVQGVLHIARQLNDILEEFDVAMLEPSKGSTFNPHLHEAIEHVADHSVPSGAIVELVQAGYQLNKKTLRPAKVKVAA